MKKLISGIIIIIVILCIFIIIKFANDTKKVEINKDVKQEIEYAVTSNNYISSPISEKNTNTNIVNKKVSQENTFTNFSWDYDTFEYFQLQLGHSISKWSEKKLVNAITNIAIANNIKIPSNIIDFTECMFYLPITNQRAAGNMACLFSYITNEIVGNKLLQLFTENYGKRYKMPNWERDFDRSDRALSALGNIGTPELMDKLNKALIELNKNKNNKQYKGPNAAIEPDRFPKESKDWLFNSPYPKVRKKMAGNWLGSERPETVEVLRRYIKKLEKTPKLDPIFIMGAREYDKPHLKEIRLKRLNDQVDRYERKYKRWIEDDKRMPLRSGCYRDEDWEEYKNESEEERKLKYLDAYKAEVPILPKELRRLKEARRDRRYKPPKRNDK